MRILLLLLLVSAPVLADLPMWCENIGVKWVRENVMDDYRDRVVGEYRYFCIYHNVDEDAYDEWCGVKLYADVLIRDWNPVLHVAEWTEADSQLCTEQFGCHKPNVEENAP